MPEIQERHWNGPESPALTVAQPWAHAIIFGKPPKDIENRTWSTTWRGRLYIHASRTDDADAPGSAWSCGDAWHQHSHGAIIGYVTVKDCVRRSLSRPGEMPASPWAEDDSPVWWVLGDPVALIRPLACAGKLGLWKVGAVQERAISRLDPGA